MPQTSIPRVAIHWTPGEKRACGRLNETISGAVDENTQMEFRPGHEVDRKICHSLVVGLCVIPHEED